MKSQSLKNIVLGLQLLAALASPAAFAAPVDLPELQLAVTAAAETATPPDAPAEFALNPVSIRKRLLNDNLSIIQALNQVHDAKDQLNVARGNLLPSISLGWLLQLGSGSFATSTVQFLLPFLMPSNWFDMYAQEHLFQAQLIAYRVLELNTYSSALSMYAVARMDYLNQQIYLRKAEDLKKIHELLREESEVTHTVPPSELAHAQAQAQMAQLQASQMSALMAQELAALRAALGLPLSTALHLEDVVIPGSPFEEKDIQETVDQALAAAPEYEQIEYLVEAAKDQRWSQAFAFVNASSVSAQTSGPQSAGFGNAKFNGSASLGFGYYPSLKLSNRNIEEIKLHKVELNQQITQVLEAGLKSLQAAQLQLTLATQAEAAMRSVYDAAREAYALQLVTLSDVLLARSQMSEASVARNKAQLDLDLYRITLHRSLLSDEFAAIKGCDLPRKDPTFWSRVKKFFGGTVSHKTLDEVCREAGN